MMKLLVALVPLSAALSAAPMTRRRAAQNVGAAVAVPLSLAVLPTAQPQRLPKFVFERAVSKHALEGEQ